MYVVQQQKFILNPFDVPTESIPVHTHASWGTQGPPEM